MIRGLWNRRVDAIIDVKLGDADADTYKYEPTTSLLTRREEIEKDKHAKHRHSRPTETFFSVYSFSERNATEGSPLVALSHSSRFTAREKRERTPFREIQGARVKTGRDRKSPCRDGPNSRTIRGPRLIGPPAGTGAGPGTGNRGFGPARLKLRDRATPRTRPRTPPNPG